MDKKDLERFIIRVKEDGCEDCCFYYKLDNDLYIVFGRDEEDILNCKIAYNVGVLRCDYDFDWYMPTNEKGELLTEAIYDISNYRLEELVEMLTAYYNHIIDCGWEIKK